METSYKIYSLAKEWWTPIASVSDTITINKMPSQSLQSLMVRICGAILDMETFFNKLSGQYQKKMITGENTDDIIEFSFLGDLRWRRGSVYFGAQYSHKTKNVRILVIGTDKIHHSAVSFGTNPIDYPIDEIYTKVKDELSKIDYNMINVSPEVENALIANNYIIGI